MGTAAQQPVVLIQELPVRSKTEGRRCRLHSKYFACCCSVPIRSGKKERQTFWKLGRNQSKYSNSSLALFLFFFFFKSLFLAADVHDECFRIFAPTGTPSPDAIRACISPFTRTGDVRLFLSSVQMCCLSLLFCMRDTGQLTLSATREVTALG